MSNDIYFRTALAGYNKSDVMHFIEKLNSDQVERVNDLNDQLRTSQTEVKKLMAEVEALRRRCDDLEHNLSVRGKGDIDNAEKAHKYDEMQKNYADIMLEAESTSMEKVKNAEAESNRIISEANNFFEEKKKILRENKEKLVAENNVIVEKSLKEMEAVMNSLSTALKDAWSIIGLGDNNE